VVIEDTWWDWAQGCTIITLAILVAAIVAVVYNRWGR
jgi:hypothetical protein